MTNITLVDFLKKYTAISNKFINEYYKFYNMCEKKYFGINIEDVIKYLDIKQTEEFYKRIRTKYTLNKDYIIIIDNHFKIKMKKYSNYYISFDTFEKICMVSHSVKADKVRDYFIILRKFINYYKNYFVDSINNEIKLNLNKCIYIILTNKNKNIFKFGNTDNIKKRLKVYTTGLDKHPDIQYIVVVDNPKEIEKCVKLLLANKQYKINHEVYQVSIDYIKNIISLCIDININDYDDNKNNAYIVFDDNLVNNKKITKKSSKKSSKKISKIS